MVENLSEYLKNDTYCRWIQNEHLKTIISLEIITTNLPFIVLNRNICGFKKLPSLYQKLCCYPLFLRRTLFLLHSYPVSPDIMLVFPLFNKIIAFP
jgi:hypothetical protein